MLLAQPSEYVGRLESPVPCAPSLGEEFRQQRGVQPAFV